MSNVRQQKHPSVKLGAMKTFFLLLLAVLQACVYVPRTIPVADPNCGSVSNHITLEAVQVAAVQRCANQGCAALVVAAGVTAAASLIISGSIALVGNVAYWLERNTQCQQVQ